MAEFLARVLTTGIVKQGGISVRITREALESFPEQVARGPSLPIIIDHDPSSLPIGRIEEAWVEPFGDEYALVARIHIEDTYSIVTHKRSGAGLVRLDFEGNPKPFMVGKYKKIEDHRDLVAVDLANFDSPKGYAAFAEDVSAIDDSVVCDNGIQRYALVPEPLLQFVLSNPELSAAMTVGAWVLGRVEKFVRYTVDETLRKTADDISDSLSTKMKSILKAYGTHRSQDNRGVVAQIVIPGNPELILLVRTAANEEFPAIDLKKLATEMERYGDLLQEANSATFARVGSDGWELQYLTTRAGKVIGTTECYERTMRAMDRMGRDRDSEPDDAPQDSDE